MLRLFYGYIPPIYSGLGYDIVVSIISPLNLNGALLKYLVETGDPRSFPKSRQSLAVKVSAAITGTVPLEYVFPFTIIVTSIGD